jgi:hypothetical protein
MATAFIFQLISQIFSSTSYSREQGSSLGAEESGEEEELTPNLETLI